MARSDEIAAVLSDAAGTVEAAKIPEQFEVAAFVLAAQALGLPAGAPPAHDAKPLESASVSSREETLGAGLTTLATKTGLDADSLGQIYQVDDDGGIALVLAPGDLPDSLHKAAAMRDVALLTVVGRQLAGVEDWTGAAVIREECKELSVFDQANFATEVRKLAMRSRGAGAKKEFRASRQHHGQAITLIATIVGSDTVEA